MSGGIAFVWDKGGDFQSKCNFGTLELEALNEEDILELEILIENHYSLTDSAVARRILDNWKISLDQFVKVMPTDYKRVLMEAAESELRAVAS